ncbi:hypothetical protein HK100_001293 [Physocladia obscura]|uniref:Ankyrin repeat protein n=1 Tax=Physocladia obscura TaxID=109957 RepID=A0AAD5SX10_9FUNG|nr:hypothetical protein HK100_001293 [Physocladia obscura]
MATQTQSNTNTNIDARIFGLIQRRDSSELATYLDALDQALPAGGKAAKALGRNMNEIQKPSTVVSTATAYTGLVSGDHDIVAALLRNSLVDASMLDNGALIAAAETGRADIVSLLLTDLRVDPLAENGRALALAAARKDDNNEMFNALFARIAPETVWDPTLPLAVAARAGNAAIVATLLKSIVAQTTAPDSERRTRVSMALVFAAENGNPESVRSFLSLPSSVIDIKLSNDAAYLIAFKYANAEVMQLLLDTNLINHAELFGKSVGPPIDLAIADPAFWVPKASGALKFYSTVCNLVAPVAP